MSTVVMMVSIWRAVIRAYPVELSRTSSRHVMVGTWRTVAAGYQLYTRRTGACGGVRPRCDWEVGSGGHGGRTAHWDTLWTCQQRKRRVRLRCVWAARHVLQSDTPKLFFVLKKQRAKQHSWDQGSYRSLVTKIPQLFHLLNDNFIDLIETITLLHKCHKWYTVSKSSETISMEQYANDKGPGQEVGEANPHWSWNTSSFWTFNGSCKFACFSIFGDIKITDICSLHDPRAFFLTFQKQYFFLTFPWSHKFHDLFQFSLTCMNSVGWLLEYWSLKQLMQN